MPRGGHREKAGRPSTWKSGCKFSETKLIRVPSVIADQVLEYAHKLDAGETLDLVTKQLSLPISQSDLIDANTRLSGVELARRIGLSSAAFTPILKQGDSVFAEYTKQRDPDGIAWIRDEKKYRPLL
jgi:hypothetical protein